MNRLTIENDGQYLPMVLCTVGRDGKVDDCDGCADYCKEQDARDNRCPGCAIQACFDRLGVYEDAGYTPEQIQNFDALYLKKCQEVNDLRKRMQWIPVTERLPKNGTRALVTFEDGFVAATDYYCNGWDLWADSGDVVAWMPLPEKYREETKTVERPKVERIIIDDVSGKRAVEIVKAGEAGWANS